MTGSWPDVPLAEIAKPISRPISVVPGQCYRTIGVKWWGEGAYERETIDGSRTAAKTLSTVHAGDLIINKIWVRHGSTAIAGPDVDGCSASGEFPTFVLDEGRVVQRWLHWQTKTSGFWLKCDALSRGTSGKNRIKPELFLGIRVPLPPLAEQRRIVARIEELAAQIQQARTLRQQATEEAEALVLSRVGGVFDRLRTNHSLREFGSFSLHVTSGPRNWAKHYTRSGVRFYRAQDIGPRGSVLEDGKVFVEPPPGDQGRSATLVHGDLMLVITGATVGRVAVYRQQLEPGFVSQHVAICRLPQFEVNPEFALWGLRGPEGQAQLIGQRYGQGKPGLNLTNIRRLSLPFPALAEQHRIVAELDALQSQVDALKGLQAETAAELDALLPAILDRAFKGEL